MSTPTGSARGRLLNFSVLFIASALIVRLPGTGLSTAEAPRYVLHEQIGFIGCLWIMFHWCSTLNLKWPSKSRMRIAALMPVASLTIAFVLLESFSAATLWGVYTYQRNASRDAIQEVINGDFSEPNWVCNSPDLCTAGRATLKQYQLNVFAEQLQAGDSGH